MKFDTIPSEYRIIEVMAVVCALLALIGWGSGDVFITMVSRKVGNGMASFWWLLLNFFYSLLFLPFAPRLTHWGMFGFALLLGFFGQFGVLWYFRALEIGNASLVGAIAGSFAVVTVPLSLILFQETLKPVQLVGIVLILIGLVLTTLTQQAITNIQKGKLFSDRGVGLALVVMFIWGIYWAFIRFPVEAIGWYWAGLPGYLFFFTLPLFGILRKNPLQVFSNKSVVFPMFCASLLTVAANYAYNIGITHGYTSVVAPIAGASPVVFVILTRLVFKEKLTMRQKIGIATTLVGIVLIGVGMV